MGSLQHVPIKLENVGIAVRDLEATIAFFTDLGLTVLGRDTVSGEWTDTAVGLDGNHARIAMLQTPDGNGRLELFEYVHPDAIETEPTRPNEIGMHRVAFSVDDIDEALRIAATHGCHPLRGVATYAGHLQADLCPRSERHPRDARGGAQEGLTCGSPRATRRGCPGRCVHTSSPRTPLLPCGGQSSSVAVTASGVMGP